MARRSSLVTPLQRISKEEVELPEVHNIRHAICSVSVPDSVKGFGRVRLQSNGFKLQEKETDTAKISERLGVFQSEMNAFTDFLKSKFFRG